MLYIAFVIETQINKRKNKMTNFQKKCKREDEKEAFLNSEAGQKWLSDKKVDNNSYVEVNGKFIKETEKAVAFEVSFDLVDVERLMTVTMWIPKSLTNGSKKVVKWFLDKKRQEFKQQYNYAAISFNF